MSDIPLDVFHRILLRLPAESLFRFRSVCKAWRCIIDDPSFVKSYYNNHQSHSTLLIRDPKGGRLYSLSLDSLNYADGCQPIDVTPVKQLIHSGVPRLYLPIASCNGLILISHFDIDKNWVIWNPLIQEFHKLPQLNIGPLISVFGYKYCGLKSSGIGYDCCNDDYKVVRIDKLYYRGIIVYRALVYSLKSGFWKMIKDFPCDVSFFSYGVFLNGSLHWCSQNGIIVLDLGTEDYSQLPRPLIPTGDDLHEHLVAVGGCSVFSYYDRNMNSLKGWVMTDYRVEKSWMKLFSIEEFGWGKPVAFLKNKGQILLQHIKGLFWFDLENNFVKKVTIDGLSYFCSSEFCLRSLLRLDDHGRATAKRTAGVKRKRKRAHTRLRFCVRLTNYIYEE